MNKILRKHLKQGVLANGYIFEGLADPIKLTDFLKPYGEVRLFAGKTGIDEIRMIREFSALSLGQAGHIFFILEASKMGYYAFPALLKVVEDAPPGRHFFLLADSSDAVPDTLRSRFIRIFPEIAEETSKKYSKFENFLKSNHKVRAGIIEALAEEPEKFTDFIDGLENWAMENENHALISKIQRVRGSILLNIGRKMCLEYLAPFIT
ncbi:MAG: hypothetical protein A2931_02740 [Candidatus Niyogibacteria bacterium RIFCSPLOWO2_01_FULL_45_48]|uniref:Uncharacterized protein n=2 Tax=Candidatus Niyogiibacteriota TaxID=1817912 RepID=A0A1G2EYY4_9BACT|nr:MAG: hypothetical protein A2835_00710 [Candidatus Niyogibacteria bacterium RIFCSPHIGHO2_01_FULL_45_28]OGZ29327.1 MAG: hypothetical protein A2931_02740 [Candidatus Niyogibacteria bacterium RIFCSPLOWO2_01_FULL_45_48]OGZ30722.1 MAG: hypothetical protein A3J00_02715 [Candidatus Niyogibacteria bacterium RIFCSPLOWO2_02_FULL_45_13]